MKNFYQLISTLVAMMMVLTGFGQISVTPENDATALANSLIGSASSITIVSATFTGDPTSAGTFTGGDFGISQGILLTSGGAALATGSNISGSTSQINGTAGDSQLDALAAPFPTNDACVLSISFIPDGNSLEFSYVFASEEYNEYVCSSFNDVFGFFVDGGAYSNENIALIPGTDPAIPVAINNVNNGTVGANGQASNCTDLQLANSAFYVDNTGGNNIEYDGYTTTLTAVIAVVPGTQYTIKLAIADAGDSALDSGVFLEGESFVSVTCDGGVVEADIDFPATYCQNNLPESITPSHSSTSSQNDSYVYAVSNSSGSIVAVVNEGDSFNPQGWDPDTYSITGISYSGNLFGVNDDGNIGNISADGCFDTTDPVSFTIEECEDVDCPELGANVGDTCDDANPNTVNDVVTVDCTCAGTLIEYDCPELGANVGNVCDDANPNTVNDMITADCTCAGTLIEYDCPELGGNIGDPCPLSTEPTFQKANAGGVAMGVIGPGCNCIPQQVNNCLNWEYFLADYVGGVTTIYKVGLNDATQEAILTVLKTVNYEVHIAYNESDGLLYLVQKSDGSFQTLDVSVVNGALSAFVPLSSPLSGSIQAGFAQNGKLIIGSQDSNEFVSVNINTGVRSFYANGDIFGGDMVFDNSAQPFFVTRSSGVLYQLNPGFTNVMIGSVPTTVTGLSLKDDNSFLVSSSGSSQLLGRTNAGANNGAYDIILNGSAFTTSSGDMSSGCAGPDFEEGDCTLFSMFYVNHDASLNGSDLYRVQFTPTDAILTFLTNSPFEAHIGFDAMNDIVYMVDKQGLFIRVYNPTLDIYLGDIPLTPGPAAITAVVFNPSDGMLYVGDDSQNKIYTIDPTNGNTVFYANAPISGGDLAIQGNILYLATKDGSKLYDMTGGIPTLIGGIPAVINGAAQANNTTDLILSNRNTTIFSSIDAATAAPVKTYNAMLNGSPFTLLNGDMAAGCADGGNVEECENFDYYYIADNTPGIPQGNVYSGEIVGTNFVLNYLFNAGMSGHLAVSTTNGNIFVVNNNGNNLKTFDASGNLLNNVNIGLNSTYACAWNSSNDMVYVGSANANEVYEVDPGTGLKTLFASGVPVQGGDLVFNNAGDLFLIERQNNPPSRLWNITTGVAVLVADVGPAINGAAITDADGFIMAEGLGSTNFHIYDGNGVFLNTLNSVDNGLNPFPLYDGDMASGCMDNVQVVPPAPFGGLQSTITSNPNPTTGPSQVVFNTPSAGKTTVEVFDMNGRNVKTLFNQMANANQEYRLDYDGSDLPNGVYIYRLTSSDGVKIQKFMIAH